ncbi:hypothetical protein SDC9_177742 [bioreactor metagenome]|uniref:Uncharacterized protein n=1 Tax=bioreactor metagenome TaxID=1076179 RepID=A0A645GWY6_9ZZZZ
MPGASACCVSMPSTAAICLMKHWRPMKASARPRLHRITGASSAIRCRASCWRRRCRSGPMCRPWSRICSRCCVKTSPPRRAPGPWVNALHRPRRSVRSGCGHWPMAGTPRPGACCAGSKASLTAALRCGTSASCRPATIRAGSTASSSGRKTP